MINTILVYFAEMLFLWYKIFYAVWVDIKFQYWEDIEILTLSDPGYWILVIPRGGVLRTHSYILAFRGFCVPPSINVDPYVEQGGNYWPCRRKKLGKLWKFDDLWCFSFVDGKIDNFLENLDFSFFELKTLISRSDLNILSSSFLQTSPFLE